MNTYAGLKGVIVKVASRCNLNCRYCYMYNHADTSYRSQPKVMSAQIVEALLERLHEYVTQYRLKEVEIIFHGGEPLLVGKHFLEDFIGKAERILPPTLKRMVGLQTNGTLLDEEWCKTLAHLHIGLGISLDGPQLIHDLDRVTHQEEGSFEATLRGLKTAQQNPYYQGHRLGVLAVLNVETDPVAMYHFYKGLQVRNLDFLWPEHHYDFLPAVYQGVSPSASHTPYGDWWIRLFKEWYSDRTAKPTIRFLQKVIRIILGDDTGFELLGRNKNQYLTIETDGGIEASDYLKSCGDRFTKEGLNVLTHRLDDALGVRLISLYQNSHRRLCPQCNRCLIKDVCGGGHIAHRYASKNGFENPSVYCFDLMKLITHVQTILLAALSKELKEEEGLAPIPFEEAWRHLEKRRWDAKPAKLN